MRHDLFSTRPASLAAVLTVTLFTLSPAQIAFERTYGGTGYDAGNAVIQTSDGGYVICGRTDSFGTGDTDVYLVKTDNMGNEVWSRTYGGSAQDYGNDVVQSPDGGYLVVGQTGSFGSGNTDVYLVKTDSAGTEVWSRTYGTSRYEAGNAVILTRHSDYVIAGWTADSFGPEGNIDIYALLVDASGDTVWTTVQGNPDSEDRGQVVVEDYFLDWYYVYGYGQETSVPWYDVAEVKMFSDGGSFGMSLYGGSYSEFAFDALVEESGGYITVGNTEETGLPDVYLTKINSWERTYGGSSYDGGYALDRTADGGIIITGYTRSFGAGQNDVYLIRTNSTGDSLWATTFGGGGWDEGNDVRSTTDGGYVIAGSTDSFGAGQSDVYLIKTDANGRVGIEGDWPAGNAVPKAFSLSQNYPNPFNPSTTIEFIIPESSDGVNVDVFIFDMRGRLVGKLVERAMKPGTHRVHWDGRDAMGRSAGSGVYIYRIQAGSYTGQKKMTLVR